MTTCESKDGRFKPTTMAAQELEIIIKGNTVQVTKSLNDMEKEFKELEKQLKTKTGPAFEKVNKELDTLRITMDKVKNIGRTGFDKFGDSLTGAGKNIKGISSAADQAAPALANLGQVARDLPFGFIAIQNNLPLLGDSLGSLVKTTGGVGKAFKAFGAALAGPAGITFAIGAVIAIVTGLINKYGSLENAIDALVHSGDKLWQQQQDMLKLSKEANKAAGDEVARYKFLQDTISNSALSLDVRKDAIKALKDEYGPYLENIKEEDRLNKGLKESTDAVTKSLQAKALATAAVAKAGELSGKVLDLLVEEDKLQKQITDRQTEQIKNRGKFRSTPGGTVDLAAEDQRVIDGLKKRQDERRKERIEIQKQIDALFGLAQAQNQTAGAGAIGTESKEEKDRKAKEKADKEEAERKRKKDEADRKAEQERKKREEAEKKAAERRLREINDEIEGVNQLTEKYKNLAIAKATQEAKIKLIGETDPQEIADINQRLQKTIKKIVDDWNSGRISAGKIDFISILDMDPVAGAKRLADLVRSVTRDAFSDVRAQAPKTVSAGKMTITPSAQAQQAITDLRLEMEALDKQAQQASNTFNQTLGPAIDGIFQAIESGKNVVSALAGVFKKLLIDIAATIVKAAILAAILSVISGGSANAAKGGMSFVSAFSKILGFGQTKGFGGAGAAFAGGGSNVSTPSFTSVSGGGQAINITGEFTARGTDMVATFNRANARIGRTG